MNRSTVRRRVLLSRETLLGALVVILASALCIGLGLWQFGRYEDRRDSAAIVDAQYDADPVPLDEVLDSPTTPLASQQQWTPVTLTGSYCDEPACVLHVRNRQLNGSVGFWETVPFRSDDGVVLFVQQADGRKFRAELPVSVDARSPVMRSEIQDLFGHAVLTA